MRISVVWGGISASLLMSEPSALTVGRSGWTAVSASPCESDWVCGRSVGMVQEGAEKEEEEENGRTDADAGLSSAELDEGKSGTRDAEEGWG